MNLITRHWLDLFFLFESLELTMGFIFASCGTCCILYNSCSCLGIWWRKIWLGSRGSGNFYWSAGETPGKGIVFFFFFIFFYFFPWKKKKKDSFWTFCFIVFWVTGWSKSSCCCRQIVGCVKHAVRSCSACSLILPISFDAIDASMLQVLWRMRF